MNAHDPGHDRGALPRGHLSQDRQAVRGRRADRARSSREVDPGDRARMVDYGRHLGTAFQLVDDVLDYRARPSRARQEPGRRPGRGQADAAADLCDLHTPRRTTRRDCAQRSKPAGSRTSSGITRAIESTGGLEYTARLARREARSRDRGPGRLPESAYQTGRLARSRSSRSTRTD